MSLSAVARRFIPVSLAILLGAGLAGCGVLGDMTSIKTHGYDLSDNTLAQIRNGQSQQLVQMVLGSPQTTNDFGGESAWYYVESKSQTTAFGMQTGQSRTVLAIYFDKTLKVKDRAVYTLKDGKTVEVETRRTPSYGEDRTFIQSIISSF